MGQHLLEDAGDIALDVVESARTVAQHATTSMPNFTPNRAGSGSAAQSCCS